MGWFNRFPILLVMAGAHLVLAPCGNCEPAHPSARYSADHIIVYFAKGVVGAPLHRSAGSIGEFTITSPAMAKMLAVSGATRLERVVPEFEHDSVHTRSLAGDPVDLPNDLTDLYCVYLADTNVVAAAKALAADTVNVRFAEPNYIGSVHFVPNDSLFAQQWWLHNSGQFGGTPGEDIHATDAWDITTGSGSTVQVGIIDTGIDLEHPDLGSPVAGANYQTAGPPEDDSSFSHGTACAGIVGARGQNREGVAGVDWGAQLVAVKACDYTGDCPQDKVTKALAWARGQGIPIVNMSFGWQEAPDGLFLEAKNCNTVGMLSFASMGNDGGQTLQYPAGFRRFTEAVGAVFNDGTRWLNANIPGCGTTGGSNWGDWIDLSAPGGKMIATTRTRATGTYYTVSGNCEDGFGGTSASAPVATGTAALLKATRATLTGEDIAQVLHRSARDKTQYGVGWDPQTGWGVVDAKGALRFITGQRVIEHGVAANVYDAGSGSQFAMSIYDEPCVSPNGLWRATRHEIRASVTFATPFVSPPDVWCRNISSVGWDVDNPHAGAEQPIGWSGVVPGSITTTGCVLYTYVYELRWYFTNAPYGWCPGIPGSARMAWTAVGPIGADPDPAQSYFVPQAGAVESPMEGGSATRYFRACPNNDGAASLPNSARIKVVARDVTGNGIAGISPADICVLFNGGTPQLPPVGQGFGGPGADSIIANSQYNMNPLCPDVRCLTADGPTDGSGTTYITFTGATPGSPGVGTRDPNRKWGHYDSELPVFILGVRLQGRLSTGDANGTYTLQIKNFDLEGGLGTTMNVGEAVLSEDFASVSNHLGEPDSADAKNWWRDFDSSGSVTTSDFNMVAGHMNHTCSYPNNP